jgi:hypothetical protein
MARAGGNPDISKAGEKYRWKKNQSGNPKGGIRKFAFEEMYCEEFKAFSGAKPPLKQIRELIEKLSSLTREELMEFAKNPNMPYSVVVHALHLLKLSNSKGTATDLRIMSELTSMSNAPKENGNDLPIALDVFLSFDKEAKNVNE